MIIIDSPFHVTISSLHESPTLACTGKCKKAWWSSDLSNRHDTGTCPQCRGPLKEAVEGVHFKILKNSKRNLKAKDLKPYMKGSELDQMMAHISNGANIGHLSMVKPAFEEMAKREWCSPPSRPT